MAETIEHVALKIDAGMTRLRDGFAKMEGKPHKHGTDRPTVFVSHSGTYKTVTKVVAKISGDVHTPPKVIVDIRWPKVESSFQDALWPSIQDCDFVLAIVTPDYINQPRLQQLVQQQGRSTRLGFVVDPEPSKVSWVQVESALMDWLPIWRQAGKSERDQHPPYLEISQSLRDGTTGRIDAAKVAGLLGLTMTEMGKVCGVTKQAISKNPTSKRLQVKLQPLVEVARGLLWFGGDEGKFKVWLRTPNPDFPKFRGRQISPLDVIQKGHAQVVADKVQNLLAGHPG